MQYGINRCQGRNRRKKTQCRAKILQCFFRRELYKPYNDKILPSYCKNNGLFNNYKLKFQNLILKLLQLEIIHYFHLKLKHITILNFF